MKTNTAFLVSLGAAVSLLALPAKGQLYEDPGPHVAGWQSVSFPSGAGTLPGRAYYPATTAGEGAPADPSGGPYPLLVLIHGQSFAPADYDLFSLHLASWGYVLVSVGPLGGPLHAPPTAAKKAVEMLAWMAAESASPTSPFAGMVSDAPYAAFGHSLGGTALEYLVELEPKLGAIVALEPYFDASATLLAKLDAFGGATLAIGGEVDAVVPPSEHAKPMCAATAALGRSVYVEVQGAAHYGALDSSTPSTLDPLPWAEQHRVHRKVATAFLEAVLRGSEDAYASLLGEGTLGEPLARESMCQDPPLWVLPSTAAPGFLTVGLGGKPLEPAWIAWSPHPASIAARQGVIGLDPATTAVVFQGALDAEGVGEAHVWIPPSSAGRTVHLQGLVVHPEGGVVTRTAAFTVP